jgi:hypothetical protein
MNDEAFGGPTPTPDPRLGGGPRRGGRLGGRGQGHAAGQRLSHRACLLRQPHGDRRARLRIDRGADPPGRHTHRPGATHDLLAGSVALWAASAVLSRLAPGYVCLPAARIGLAAVTRTAGSAVASLARRPGPEGAARRALQRGPARRDPRQRGGPAPLQRARRHLPAPVARLAGRPGVRHRVADRPHARGDPARGRSRCGPRLGRPGPGLAVPTLPPASRGDLRRW